MGERQAFSIGQIRAHLAQLGIQIFAKKRVQNFEAVVIAIKLAEDLDLRHGPATGQLHAQRAFGGIDILGPSEISHRGHRQRFVIESKPREARFLSHSIKARHGGVHIAIPQCGPSQDQPVDQGANALFGLNTCHDLIKTATRTEVGNQRHIGQLAGHIIDCI